MKITERVLDAKTGEYFEREIDLPGLLTEAEAIAKDAADALEARKAAIRAQLAANDINAVRAISEAIRTGDKSRLEAHEAAQQELRNQLQGRTP